MEIDPQVIIVMLRQPRKNDSNERRSDPFYEFGSFGCTGCHKKNLLHPRNGERIAGHRLAFAQGGADGFRLVYLTPPISVQTWPDRCEVHWQPVEMPFCYQCAPILASNEVESDFPALAKIFANTLRSTPVAGFASCFRSRTSPLNATVSDEIIRVYTQRRTGAKSNDIATSYEQALPYDPPIVDRQRKWTYEAKIQELKGGGKLAAKSSCGSSTVPKHSDRKGC